MLFVIVFIVLESSKSGLPICGQNFTVLAMKALVDLDIVSCASSHLSIKC